MLLGASACEAPDLEGVDGLAARLEQRAQTYFARAPKTGMLRALQVSRRAAQVAHALGHRPHRACAVQLAPAGALDYAFELRLERQGPHKLGTTARWHETRHLRRSPDGWLELVMAAEFRHPSMLETDLPGRRALRWVIADGVSYLSDDLGEDPPEFYRRRANFGEREALEFAGLSTLQTLLDSVPQGWQRVPGGAPRWKPGGQRLRCIGLAQGLQNDKSMPMHSQQIEASWRRLFGEVATPVEAEFEVLEAPDGAGETPGSRRRLTLAWRLSDGATLRAEFRDAWSDTPGPIVLPAAERIVEVERDRSLFEASQRLQKWRDSAWITAAAEVEEP